MAKTTKKSSSNSRRPKPVSGKGSYTATSRRYSCGGKIKK